MRQLTLAAGVACAVVLSSPVGAQFNALNTGGLNNSNSASPAPMPGQIVGGYTGTVNPVGTKLPAAAPQAGQPITANAMQRPFDPKHPYDMFKGTNIDTKQILAPLVGPDGKPVEPPDALDKLSDKIKALWGLAAPAPPRPPWAPGIARRNKERVQQMWRRD